MTTIERALPKATRKTVARPAPGAAALWERPGYLVRRLHQIGGAIFLNEMSDLELTPLQFGALTIVAARPGIEQSALGEELGIDRVNAGDIVLRLIKNELVRREVSVRDRRYKEVSLTPAGADILREGTQRIAKIQDRLLHPLTRDERHVFMELVRKLINGNNDQGRAPLRLPERDA